MTTNAATLFFAQQNQFAQTMGQVVGGASVDLINADILGNQQRAAFYGTLLVDENGKARPPLKIAGDFAFVDKGAGIDEDANFSISIPMFELADLTTFQLSTADIEMRLNIKAHAADTSKYAATQKLVANEHMDWGVFGESSTLTATAAESGSSTRSSDYRAKCSVKAAMKRSAAPEGVMRTLDFYGDLGDIEKDYVRRLAAAAAQKQAEKDKIVVPSGGPDTGDDTGGSDTGPDDEGGDNPDDQPDTGPDDQGDDTGGDDSGGDNE